MRTDGELTEHDHEQVAAFEADLEMAGDIADRWGIDLIEAAAWVYERGYNWQ